MSKPPADHGTILPFPVLRMKHRGQLEIRQSIWHEQSGSYVPRGSDPAIDFEDVTRGTSGYHYASHEIELIIQRYLALPASPAEAWTTVLQVAAHVDSKDDEHTVECLVYAFLRKQGQAAATALSGTTPTPGSPAK